jgi:urease beta subunit
MVHGDGETFRIDGKWNIMSAVAVRVEPGKPRDALSGMSKETAA